MDAEPVRDCERMTELPPRTCDRIRIGRVWLDSVTRAEALDKIRQLVARRLGGCVFTPNVDHILLAETNPEFRRAYRRADLVLADGVPVVWASKVLRVPVPEKLSGSDMVLPIARLAAAEGWRVYLLGGNAGVAKVAAERLEAREGVLIAGVDDPFIQLDGAGDTDRAVIARIRKAEPDLLFVALGAPKQELWISRHKHEIAPAVAIGVGASLDFVAGRLTRAPHWISAAGLEWLYRLVQEPRRLWRRYLLRGPRFIPVLLRGLASDRRSLRVTRRR
jgi:N-acetylglucosaminyldiphosphoundecaprenol N-acetyl-beta-D-mannosaminyltransferase